MKEIQIVEQNKSSASRYKGGGCKKDDDTHSSTQHIRYKFLSKEEEK
jgi:hypothetical protein